MSDWRIIWAVAAFCGGLAGAYPPAAAKDVSRDVYRKLDTFSRVLNYVETNYIENVSAAALIDDAIRGMLTSLDPHTRYVPAGDFRQVKLDTRGEFGGLGMELTVRDGRLTVVTPIENTPAERAGIKSGDVIIAVDGKSTQGLTMDEAVELLRGPLNSRVILTLERSEAAFDVELRRSTIRIQSVHSKDLGGGFGYLRLKNFQERTERDFLKHIRALEKSGPLKGLVLDVRNNPGGLFEEAVRVADLFLDGGIIVSTVGRDGVYQEVEMAKEGGTLGSMPVITLVNEGSASAAEILAGALQDHGRSVILGMPTFGKGSVQTIIELPDGSGLKLTISRYYTPKGRSIQAQGIVPDITVSPDPPSSPQSGQLREKDFQGHLEAKDIRVGTEPPGAEAGYLKDDIQFQRALEYLKTWEVFRRVVPREDSVL